MGASFDYTIVRAKDFGKACKEFRSDILDSQNRRGREYSGEIGMLNGCDNAGKQFNSISEAVDYIQETHDKWEPALAVKAVDGEETDASKKKNNKLYALKTEALKKHDALKAKINTEIKNQKSQFRGCSKCKSRVNKQYVPHSHCPVCGESYLTYTHKQRIKALWDKAVKAEQAWKNNKPVLKKKKEVWVIGGWCAC